MIINQRRKEKNIRKILILSIFFIFFTKTLTGKGSCATWCKIIHVILASGRKKIHPTFCNHIQAKTKALCRYSEIKSKTCSRTSEFCWLPCCGCKLKMLANALAWDFYQVGVNNHPDHHSSFTLDSPKGEACQCADNVKLTVTHACIKDDWKMNLGIKSQRTTAFWVLWS